MGKTMIVSIVIDHLQRLQLRESSVAYIFCNYKERGNQNLVDLLSSLLADVLRHVPEAYPSIKDALSKHREHGTRPLINDLEGYLQQALSHQRRNFIVIDALDEYQDNHYDLEELVSVLRKLQASTNMNILTSSRSIPSIENLFWESSRLEISADISDIEEYVEGQILRLTGQVRGDPTLQERIKSEIAQAAGGMCVPLIRGRQAPFTDSDQISTC